PGSDETLPPAGLEYTSLNYSNVCDRLALSAQERVTVTISWAGVTLPFNDTPSFQAVIEALYTDIRDGRFVPQPLGDHPVIQVSPGQRSVLLEQSLAQLEEDGAHLSEAGEHTADAGMQQHEVISIHSEDDVDDAHEQLGVAPPISEDAAACTLENAEHGGHLADDLGFEAGPTELEIIESNNSDGLAFDGIMDKMCSIDFVPQKFIARVAAFFQVSENELLQPNTVRLPGTKLFLNLHQIVLVYRIVVLAGKKPELAGHYIADSMGLGKTITTLAPSNSITTINRDGSSSNTM
ncbi:hypothetical protein IL306_000527, partial [Fusarium sp. DS 682]